MKRVNKVKDFTISKSVKLVEPAGSASHSSEANEHLMPVTPNNGPPPTRKGGNLPRPLSKPRPGGIDPDKLLSCSAARAAQIGKKAVWKELKARAKAAGIKLNPNGRVGPEICDVFWLYPEVVRLRNEFAELIDEDLAKLQQPGVEREVLLGKIYVHQLCIQAARTIFFGEDSV